MDAGLQIKELAKAPGVTPDSIINWEIRGTRPTKKNLERLTNALPDRRWCVALMTAKQR
jgi:hypothetical protein